MRVAVLPIPEFIAYIQNHPLELPVDGARCPSPTFPLVLTMPERVSIVSTTCVPGFSTEYKETPDGWNHHDCFKPEKLVQLVWPEERQWHMKKPK